jgi:hypothetical protein
LDTIANSDGDSHITNSSDGTLGFELVTVDDFKISVVGDGKSEGISSSIYIGSTKGANHGAGGLTFEKGSIADLDIGWGNIV